MSDRELDRLWGAYGPPRKGSVSFSKLEDVLTSEFRSLQKAVNEYAEDAERETAIVTKLISSLPEALQKDPGAIRNLLIEDKDQTPFQAELLKELSEIKGRLNKGEAEIRKNNTDLGVHVAQARFAIRAREKSKKLFNSCDDFELF